MLDMLAHVEDNGDELDEGALSAYAYTMLSRARGLRDLLATGDTAEPASWKVARPLFGTGRSGRLAPLSTVMDSDTTLQQTISDALSASLAPYVSTLEAPLAAV